MISPLPPPINSRCFDPPLACAPYLSLSENWLYFEKQGYIVWTYSHGYLSPYRFQLYQVYRFYGLAIKVFKIFIPYLAQC